MTDHRNTWILVLGCLQVILIGIAAYTLITWQHETITKESIAPVINITCPENVVPSYGFNKYSDQSTTGVFFPGETICIYVGDRSYEEINNTVNHEYLHYLIHEQREHFCGEGKVN